MAEFGAPFNYEQMNVYSSSFSPGTVHVKNTRLAGFFRRYLYEKLYSNFEFTLPDGWDLNYFRWSLFTVGRLAVFDDPKFGKIFQHCTLNGRGLYYQPTRAMIANPLLPEINNGLEIGTECALVKMQPDYCGADDLISFYADMLALCAEAAGMNVVNSKLSYVFMAQNKAGAEAFKKVFDMVQEGNPAVVIDKDLVDEEGRETWLPVFQDLARNYIAGDILEDMAKWDARFNTEIGIPNVNIAKQSGVSADEIHANDIDSHAKAYLWRDEIRRGFDEANRLYDLGLSVKLRFDAPATPESSGTEIPPEVE